jgi:hypothetical protein
VFAHWPESNVLPLIHDEEHQLDRHPAVVIAMANIRRQAPLLEAGGDLSSLDLMTSSFACREAPVDLCSGERLF